jgi:hypothetical protein
VWVMMIDVRVVVSCVWFSSLLFCVNISFARLDIELAHTWKESKLILIKELRSYSILLSIAYLFGFSFMLHIG